MKIRKLEIVSAVSYTEFQSTNFILGPIVVWDFQKLKILDINYLGVEIY